VKRLTVFFLITIMSSTSVLSGERLNIRPTVQQTEVWCWAAVSEMSLGYYGYGTINPAGNYQCGLVAMLGGICNQNCFYCRTGIGNLYNMVAVLERYAQIAQSLGVGGQHVRFRIRGRLSESHIMREIEDGNPIVAGISPSGFAAFYPPSFGEHVALIIGYEGNRHDLWLIVNDPMPYRMIGNDPYLRAGARMLRDGQYTIPYNSFVNRLGFKDSITFR